MTPIVELTDVSFYYHRTRVLHDISFSLPRGSIVGLLGPNGAGKSTTLKLMAGMLRGASGTIRVAGLPLPEQAVSVKQRIGFVHESGLLFETLTGQEYLELAGRLHDVSEPLLQQRIAAVLQSLGLADHNDARMDTYSKGMRQKILIGAALLHGPELVLLDEPLTGLDVNAAVLIKDLLASLAAAGTTIIYSSHVLDVVERICDRALIIHQGRLIADAPPADLMAATGSSSLEGVFRQMTGASATQHDVSRIIEALR